MSQFWRDADEVARAVTGMYDRIRDNEEVVAQTSKLDMIIVYRYFDPDVQIWWSTKGGTFAYGVGEPPAPFDVRMTLSADDAHRAWSQKLNAVLAITRRKIKVEGSVTRMLKMSYLQKHFAAAYRQALEEMGRGDLVA